MIDTFIPGIARPPSKSEGELYKRLEIFGRAFEIFYGYYEECERDNPQVEPMPIYPDFIINPQFTEDGHPFVTKMQDACGYYKGKISMYPECAECKHYRHGDDFLGICINESRRKIK